MFLSPPGENYLQQVSVGEQGLKGAPFSTHNVDAMERKQETCIFL